MDGFAELIERKRQGSLKVYLGYAAGVGKTYAMLQEGLRLKQQHVDVVIGYLEPHDRPETMALAEHLETVPPREWRVGDAVFHEMDVEAILARKPQVVLVDELAHTNAEGCRHVKRILHRTALGHENPVIIRHLHFSVEIICQHLCRLAGARKPAGHRDMHNCIVFLQKFFPEI